MDRRKSGTDLSTTAASLCSLYTIRHMNDTMFTTSKCRFYKGWSSFCVDRLNVDNFGPGTSYPYVCSELTTTPSSPYMLNVNGRRSAIMCDTIRQGEFHMIPTWGYTIFVRTADIVGIGHVDFPKITIDHSSPHPPPPPSHRHNLHQIDNY